jgi:hypothetical protein
MGGHLLAHPHSATPCCKQSSPAARPGVPGPRRARAGHCADAQCAWRDFGGRRCPQRYRCRREETSARPGLSSARGTHLRVLALIASVVCTSQRTRALTAFTDVTPPDNQPSASQRHDLTRATLPPTGWEPTTSAPIAAVYYPVLELSMSMDAAIMSKVYVAMATYVPGELGRYYLTPILQA